MLDFVGIIIKSWEQVMTVCHKHFNWVRVIVDLFLTFVKLVVLIGLVFFFWSPDFCHPLIMKLSYVFSIWWQWTLPSYAHMFPFTFQQHKTHGHQRLVKFWLKAKEFLLWTNELNTTYLIQRTRCAQIARCTLTSTTERICTETHAREFTRNCLLFGVFVWGRQQTKRRYLSRST